MKGFLQNENLDIPAFTEEELRPNDENDILYQQNGTVVFIGVKEGYGKVCAKKVVGNNKYDMATSELIIFLNAQSQKIHKNIVHFLGILYGRDLLGNYKRVGFVMEYMEGGSLAKLIHDTREVKYGLREILLWSIQAAEGLVHLHEMDIIHRDVKPSNMLLTKDRETLKLSDFGISREIDNAITANMGTKHYMAPEAIMPQVGTRIKYNVSVDIFSLGICIWEMFYRKVPFNAGNPNVDTHALILAGHRPLLTDDIDETLGDLIKKYWSADPKKRPSSKQVVRELNVLASRNRLYKSVAEPERAPVPLYRPTSTTYNYPPPLASDSRGPSPAKPSTSKANTSVSTIKQHEDSSSDNWETDEEERKRLCLPKKVAKVKKQPKVREDPIVEQMRNLSVQNHPKPEIFSTLNLNETIIVYLFFNKPTCYAFLLNKLAEFLTEMAIAVVLQSDGDSTHRVDSIGLGRDGLFVQAKEYLLLKGIAEPTTDLWWFVDHSINVLFLTYNSVYFNNCTPNKLEKTRQFLQNNVPHIMQAHNIRVRNFLQTQLFTCLVVGRWQCESRDYFVNNVMNNLPSVNRIQFSFIDLPNKPKFFDENAILEIRQAIKQLQRVHSLVFILDSEAKSGKMGEIWNVFASNKITTFVLTIDRRRRPIQTEADLQKIYDRFIRKFTIPIEKINLLPFFIDDPISNMTHIFEIIYERAMNTLIHFKLILSEK